MPSGQAVIVGGGVSYLAPVTLGYIPTVTSVGPPGTLSDSVLRQWMDGLVGVVTTGAVDVASGTGATETVRLSEGFISQGLAPRSTIIGQGASVDAVGQDSGIAIGDQAIVGDGTGLIDSARAIAIGHQAVAAGNLGWPGSSSAPVALGENTAAWNGSVSVGAGAGQGGDGTELQAVAIGAEANAYSYAVAIGMTALASQEDSIAIGHLATITGLDTADHDNIAIGSLAAILDGERCIVVGHNSNAGVGGPTVNDILVLGSGMIAGVEPPVSNRAYIGAPQTDIQALVIGVGESEVSPPTRLLRFTNASGVDNAATGVEIRAPFSTGAAASASMYLTVGSPVASGAALHDVFRAALVSYTNAAGETGLSIYDVNTAVMQRIRVGAAGTGPGGAGRALYLT